MLEPLIVSLVAKNQDPSAPSLLFLPTIAKLCTSVADKPNLCAATVANKLERSFTKPKGKFCFSDNPFAEKPQDFLQPICRKSSIPYLTSSCRNLQVY
eukprot:c20692_g1_i1 orf=835-1128(-)